MMTTEPSPWQLSKLYPLMNILRYPGKDSPCTLGSDRFVSFILRWIKPLSANCFYSRPVFHKTSLPWAPWRWSCDDRDWTTLTSWWSDYGRSDSGLWDPRSAKGIYRVQRSIHLFTSIKKQKLYFRDNDEKLLWVEAPEIFIRGEMCWETFPDIYTVHTHEIRGYEGH